MSGAESTDESQASQLLAAALRPRELQPASSNPPASHDPHAPDGSLPSSSDHSVHYHIHGLIATQTQSLYGSEDHPNLEGSQKENTPASLDKDTSQPHISSPVSSPIRPQAAPSYTAQLKETTSKPILSSKVSKENPCSKDPTDILLSPAKAGKAVSFASPSRPMPRPQRHSDRPSITSSRTMPPPPRPRSSSPASQDSFAGPLPEPDPAKAFLARAKNFAIPLAQIGEVSQSTSDEEGPPPVSYMRKPLRHDSAYRSRSPTEKVLVTGTPSSSSHDSQPHVRSHLQARSHANASESNQADSQDGSTQLSDSFPQAQNREHDIDLSEYPAQATRDNDDGVNTTPPSPRDASTEPTSSYERLLNQDPFSPLPEATQSLYDDDTLPTQVVNTQLTHTSDRDWNDDSPVILPSVSPQARSSNTSRSTIPRRLLAMVPPEKRYRYEGIMQDTVGPSNLPSTSKSPGWNANTQDTQPPDVPSSSALTEDTELQDTQPSDIHPHEVMEQTQPSDVAVNGSIASVYPRRRLPPANHFLQSQQLPPSAPAPAKTPEPHIIPDSEELAPTQVVPDSDPPSPPPPRRKLPSASSAATYHSPNDLRPRRYLQSEDEVLRTIATVEPSVPPVEEEEEEDGEDEEVPLAAAIRLSKEKGKQKATAPAANASAVPSPVPAKGRGSKPPPSPTKAARGAGTNQKSSSWKDAVVPSSDPREYHEDVAPKPTAAKFTKPRTPVNPPPPPPPRSRSARKAKLAAQKRLHESSTDDEDEDAEMAEHQSDDQDTVSAEGERMDVDPPDVKPTVARGGKRKRTVSSSAKKAPPKKLIKEESSTPLGRPAKRFKPSSVPRPDSAGAATRVFALWKSNAQYYTGVVHSTDGHGRYNVVFDDNDNADVELKHIRACQLKHGDHVLFRSKRKAIVVDPPSCPDTGYLAEDTVTVDLGDGEHEEVQVQELQIASRTVVIEWGDRMLSDRTVVPVIRPKVSPTPSRLSVPSEGSTRGAARRLLAKLGLVVSLSPKNSTDQRDGLLGEIRRHGGVVLDDWTNVFAMEGALEHKSQRWMLKADDVQWRKRNDVDRVFLISDDSHQKAKFLIALALGIPCVSVEWLRASISEGEEKDWQPYLLSAGFSEHLDARVSQMVDLGWGSSPHYLTAITTNRVSPKVLTDKCILCVSPDFVPAKQKSKKNGGDAFKNEAAQNVPRIVLCMGAATVEAVADAKHASKTLDKYDYVIVPDGDLSKFNHVDSSAAVSWVKDCLISGRLLPVPSLHS